jgi:4-amino-4-deoxy-L-arabinose transferase-like glycosyltransferase
MAATQIATPGTPSALRPPAYPYLLGGLYALFGTDPLVGRLLGAALGVVAVVLIALLGPAVWDRRVGLIAGALAAVFLPLAGLNATLLSESLLIPLELATALCLLALARSGNARWAAAAGALCGLAALTRTVGILWLIPSAGAVIAADGGRRSRARAIAAMLAATLVVLTPWTVRNANAFHAFIPLTTQDGFTLAGQYNTDAGQADRFQAIWRVPLDVETLRAQLAPLYFRPGGVDEAQLDGALRHAGFSYLGRHPGHLAVATWLDTLRMLDLGINHSFTTGIAYREMGLPRSLWRATSLSAQLVALIPLLAIAATLPLLGTPRYRSPADPFLVLLAAVGLGALIDPGVRGARTRLTLRR